MTPCEDIAQAIITVKKKHPLLPITTAFMGGGSVDTARSILRTNAIPSFETPEEAVRMMATLMKKKRVKEETEEPTDDDRSSTAHGLLKGRSGLLSESLAGELLSLYGLPSPSADIAHSAEEAEKIAKTIGLPVIAKISSPDILHKTDIGGVRADLTTGKDVRTAYTDITKNVAKALPSAGINGVLIQKFLPIGSEFIVGGIRDSSAGPLVMVGLGGIYTELFCDTAFRIAPTTMEETYAMLSSLKSWKLLQGMRGKAPLAIDSLVTVVKTVSHIMADCPMISEIDLNPVLVGEKQIVIADVKIVTK
jgi:acetyltransferase